MGLTIVYVILAVFLVVFGLLKIRVAGHTKDGIWHLALGAVAIGLAVWPVIQVVQFFGACSCR